jgi:hypothetical protein
MEESREKYWSELTTDEKVKRMRDQVKSLIRIVDRLDYKLNLLLRHSHHDHEGRVTVSIDECRQVIGEKVRPDINKDDVYF